MKVFVLYEPASSESWENERSVRRGALNGDKKLVLGKKWIKIQVRKRKAYGYLKIRRKIFDACSKGKELSVMYNM